MSRHKTLLIVSLAVMMVAVPFITLAAFKNPTPSIKEPADLIKNIIEFFLLIIFIPLTLLGIMYGGLTIIIGGFGNEQSVARGKQIIVWSLIGLVIVLTSYIIFATVVGFVGFR